MSEIPEIERLRDIARAGQRGQRARIDLDLAEDAVASALDRQAREIVEALRHDAEGMEADFATSAYTTGIFDAARVIESRFAPKEADPR